MISVGRLGVFCLFIVNVVFFLILFLLKGGRKGFGIFIFEYEVFICILMKVWLGSKWEFEVNILFGDFF